MSNPTPARFVEEMLRLQGIPYIHQSRDVRLGLDCAGAVIVAASNAGWEARNPALSLQADYEAFPKDDIQMQAALLDECDLIERKNAQFGDIISMQFDASLMPNEAQYSIHVGVLVPPPLHVRHRDFYLCHAVSGRGVKCHIWADEWQRRTSAIYRIKGFEAMSMTEDN